MLEKRAKQPWAGPLGRDRGVDLCQELTKVLRDVVGQVTVFGVAPDPLAGIELRGVGRKPFGHQPFGPCFQEAPHCRPVDAPAVQDQHDLTPQPTMHPAQELQHLLGADVVGVDLEVKPQPAPLRSHGKGRDGRETVVSVPALLDPAFGPVEPRCAAPRAGA